MNEILCIISCNSVLIGLVFKLKVDEYEKWNAVGLKNGKLNRRRYPIKTTACRLWLKEKKRRKWKCRMEAEYS